MTPLMLLDSLSDFIRDKVKDFRLPIKKHLAPPMVYKGYLPMEDDDEIICPYVIVRLAKVTDAEKMSTARIAILVGTRAVDDDFWRDCVNVAERIRQELMLARIIDKRFQLQLPLEIEFPEGEMPYPEAVCMLSTLWTIPQPQQRMEENVYGSDIPGC